MGDRGCTERLAIILASYCMDNNTAPFDIYVTGTCREPFCSGHAWISRCRTTELAKELGGLQGLGTTDAIRPRSPHTSSPSVPVPYKPEQVTWEVGEMTQKY